MTVLEWLAPPLVGAAIGYITNDIAIRMLFRPLREYRILGIRVPFTPGIIPRHRGDLAKAVGRMVAEELITAETVGHYLKQSAAREGFRAWVSRATSSLLERNLASLAGSSSQSSTESSSQSSTAKEVGSFALELLEGLFASPRFPEVVGSAVHSAERALGSSSLQSLAGGDPARAVARALVGGEDDGRRRAPWTPDSIEAAARMAQAASPPAGEALGRWLASPEIRPEIEQRAREFVRSTLDKLSGIQRLVVRAAQYDKRLEAKLPEIVDDAFGQIEDFLAESTVADSLGQAVRELLEREANPEGDQGTRWLTQGAVGDALVDFLAALLRPYFTDSLEGTLGRLAGSGREELVGRIVERIVQGARRPGAAAALAASVREAANRSLGGSSATIGELLGISPETKARIDDALAAKALELVEARLADVLRGLNVRAMVVERIDSLDVLAVEKLLLMVIAQHLKWINIFGAILGGIIGLTQVILRLLL